VRFAVSGKRELKPTGEPSEVNMNTFIIETLCDDA
jgi:hypothetical protein